MIRRIVVLLEDVATVDSIPPTVQGFAQLADARVTLLQVLSAGAAGANEQVAREKLAAVAQRFDALGIAVDIRVSPGQAAEQIIQAGPGYDLIAIVARDGADRALALLGSDAGQAGRSVPVLLIRVGTGAGSPPGPPRRLLVPLDSSPVGERALPLYMFPR